MAAIAGQLGVNARTVQRDLKELRLLGIDISVEKGRLYASSAVLDQFGGGPGSGAALGLDTVLGLSTALGLGARRATEREARQFLLLKYVHEEPGAFEPARLCAVLARRLEVAGRTIERDLTALKDRGLVVVEENRCYLGRAFLPRISFTAEQVLALLGYMDVQGELLPWRELRSAKTKLADSLLGQAALAGAKRAGEVRTRRLVKGRYYLQPPEIEDRVMVLEEACHSLQRVSFLYRASDGHGGSRLVDPLGLVYYWFQDAWYLVAATEGGVRHYRLDRMDEVEVTGETFTYPHGFDLAEHMAPCWGVEHGELQRVRIRFFDEFNVLNRLRQDTAHRVDGRIDPELGGGGTVIYSDVVAGLNEIRVWVRSFGSSAEVLESEQLRDDVIESARRIVAVYERKAGRKPEADREVAG